MWLTRVSLARPVLVVMLMVGLCVLGWVSYLKLRVEQLPDLNLPVAWVDIQYPGASPVAVEEEVTKRVEDALNSVAGVKRIMSRSFEGRSQSSVEFTLNTDMGRAMQELRDRLSVAQALFPKDVKQPLLQRINNETSEPIAIIGLLSSERAIRDLSMLAQLQVVRRLQRIEGVAQIKVSGNATREIRVDLNVHKLRSHGLTPSDVASALRLQNNDLPIGLVSDASQDAIVRIEGRVKSYLDLQNFSLASVRATPLVLSQVAHVYEREREPDSLARINGQRAISIEIIKQQDANVVVTGSQIKLALEDLRKQMPQDTELRLMYLSSDWVKGALDGVKATLIEGGLLTVAIVFLFLKSWRSTVITGLTLPISVISSFIAIQALGFTLNFMTMMALSLCIGLLIDDAIVVRENIVRHLLLGKSHREAARDGTDEIGLAVLATTFAICAVFVPMAFMDGIIGRLFHPFGVTVVCSVLVSLFVSFTLDPMLSSIWHDKPPAPWQRRVGLLWATNMTDRFMQACQAGYEKLIAWIFSEKRYRLLWLVRISPRAIVLCLAGFCMLLSFALLTVLGTEFIPQSDRGYIQTTMRLPVGSSLVRSSEIMRQVEQSIADIPEIQTVVSVIGGSEAGFLVGRNQATLNITLKPRSERDKGQKEVEALIRKKLAPIPGIEASVGTDRPIYVALLGNDSQKLAEFTRSFAQKMTQIPGLVDIDMSAKPGLSAYSLQLDTIALRELGLNVSQVGTSLRGYVNGEIASYWQATDGEQVPIVLRLPQIERSQIEQLMSLPVAYAKNGQAIELSRVARIEKTDNPEVIRRQNLLRREAIFASTQGRSSGDVGKDVQALVKATTPPEGIVFDVGGQTRDQQEAFAALGGAMLMAVVFIYLVLASQFNSFVQPLAIMVSLPLALIGVVLALLITRSTVNLFTLIGVIMLMGLVTKNAILLIDFANQRRALGQSIRDALLAAGQIRMRPIMMTTFAMVFGMLPLSLALNEGGELQAGMGRAIIGGVITSTLLTLIVIPVIYSYLVRSIPVNAKQQEAAVLTGTDNF